MPAGQPTYLGVAAEGLSTRSGDTVQPAGPGKPAAAGKSPGGSTPAKTPGTFASALPQALLLSLTSRPGSEPVDPCGCQPSPAWVRVQPRGSSADRTCCLSSTRTHWRWTPY